MEVIENHQHFDHASDEDAEFIITVDIDDTSSFRPYPILAEPVDFVLPPIRSSFDRGLCHPHYDAVRAVCDECVLSCTASAACAPELRKALVESCISLIVCLMIPFAQASTRRQILCAKMAIWITLHDNDLDNVDALGANVSGAVSRFERIVADIAPEYVGHGAASTISVNKIRSNHDDANHNSPSFSPIIATDHETALLRFLREIWSEFRRDMPPALYSRFVLSFVNQMHAANAQAVLHSSGLLPAKSYARIRRPASSALIALHFAEFAMGMDLDGAVYGHPLVKELRQAVVEYMWVCNDLASCRVEVKAGEYFNLPSVLYSGGEFRSFQEAVEAGVRIADELDSRCIELSERIQSSVKEGLLGEGALSYAELLTSCAAGVRSWCLQTSRYGAK